MSHEYWFWWSVVTFLLSSVAIIAVVKFPRHRPFELYEYASLIYCIAVAVFCLALIIVFGMERLK